MYKLVAVIAIIFSFTCQATVLASEERGYTIKYKVAEFEDVFLDVQDAIINRGLVIDYTGHINKMLERTAEAATDGTGTKTPFRNAKFLQFCSSVLTHEAVRIKPQNLATCPYVIFVYQTIEKPNQVAVGYRNPELNIPGPTRLVMEKLDALLNEIIVEATSD